MPATLTQQGMEIAGSTCAICGRHIVLAREGKYCPACKIAVHRECAAHNTCACCGGEYQMIQPPIVDGLRDAILPRNLRWNTQQSPVAILILAALLLLLLGLVFFVVFRTPE